MSTLTLLDLEFTLRESSRRKSIGITVERDGSLILAAPKGTPMDKLQAAVKSKQLWIHKKLVQKESRARQAASKEFISGEGFFYLGRSYRLLLLDSDERKPLRFYRGRFELERRERRRAREHFVSWYKLQVQVRLEREMSELSRHLEVVPKGMSVRDLAYRWGSCTASGVLYFHWRIAMLPPQSSATLSHTKWPI